MKIDLFFIQQLFLWPTFSQHVSVYYYQHSISTDIYHDRFGVLSFEMGLSSVLY